MIPYSFPSKSKHHLLHSSTTAAITARVAVVSRGPRSTAVQTLLAKKDVWIETTSQQTFTSALEAGATTFLFQEANSQLIDAWQNLGAFDAVLNCGGALEQSGKQVTFGTFQHQYWLL